MKRQAITILLTCIVACCARSAHPASAMAPDEAILTDDRTISEPAATARPRDVLWTPAVPVSGGANSSADEYEPRVSPDGMRLLFVCRRPGANADLVESRWSPTGWSVGTPIEALNSSFDELGPEFSPDGRTLLFYSNREGGLGGYDLWRSELGEDGAWSSPINLGASVNTPANEYGPALTPDGRLLYFASNRSPETTDAASESDRWIATLREPRGRRDYDLYRIALDGPSDRRAERVTELCTDADEGSPAISPAGDFLYFASDRVGGAGGFDLYRVRLDPSGLPTSDWPIESLGAAINTASNELDPGLAAEGFRIYFSSDRNASDRAYDLFTSTSREVHRVEARATEEAAAEGSALAALWQSLWPWLLLLLLLALLALLLALLATRQRVWRDRLGTMGLLARCALISILLHLLIAALLAAWKVGGIVADRFGGSGHRVLLSTANAATDAEASLGAVHEQLRGEATRTTLAEDLIRPEAIDHRITAPPPERTASATDAPTADELPTLMMELASDANERLLASDPSDPRVALAPVAASIASPPAESEPLRSLDVRTPASIAPVSVAETPMPSLASATVPPAAHSSRSTMPVATDASPAPTMDAPPASPSLTDRERERVAEATQASAIAVPSPPSSPPSTTPATSAPSVQAARPAAPAPRPAERDEPNPRPADALAGALADAGLPPLTATAAARGETRSAPQPDAGSIAPMPSAPLPTADLVAVPPIRPSAPSPAPVRQASGAPDAIAIAPLDGAAAPRVPAAPAPLEEFAQRDPTLRESILAATGGSDDTERAVRAALEWLSRNQHADGHWSARDHGGEVDADGAMTGLALLAFLGAGHTHRDQGPYRATIDRGIAWLLARQAPDGDLRGGRSRADTMYGQTIATVALCEAYAMTRDASLADPVRRALAFVLAKADAAQRGEARAQDTAVLGWLVMTVESARRAGFDPPMQIVDGARRWLDQVSAPPSNGRYAYRRGERPSAAMTAEAMFVQQLLGRSAAEARMVASAEFIAESLPQWSSDAPTHHWYYATLALFQHQGEPWERWNAALTEALLRNQRTDGALAGSWDPQDRWSRAGGRVYQTAVCALSLEVYYRYAVRAATPD